MKNYILSIGVGQYENQGAEIQNLGKTPKNDCKRLSKVLCGKKYGFEKTQAPLFDASAKSRNVLNAFDDLSLLEEDAQLIVLFSGHGDYLADLNMSYWLMYNATERSKLDFSKRLSDQGWISAKTIVEKLSAIRCRHVLILADCCFAGHLFFNFKGIGSAIYPDSAKLAVRKKSREILVPCGMTQTPNAPGSGGISLFIESIIHTLEQVVHHTLVSPRVLYMSLFSSMDKTTPQYGHLGDDGEYGGSFLFTHSRVLDEMLEEPFEEEGLLHHVTCKKIERKFQPINSRIDRDRYLKDFVGRQWVIEEIDRWIDGRTSPLFWLTGEPGIGNSAMSAYLVEHSELIRAHHFFLFDKASTLSLKEVAKSLAYQLSCFMPDYAKYVDNLDEVRLLELDEQSFFDELIILPLSRKIKQPAIPVVILLDGLDEANSKGRNAIAEYVAKLLGSTSAWLRVILTSRTREHEINQPLSMFQPWVMDANDPRNRADLHYYLQKRLPDHRLEEGIVSAVLEKSEGNFLYIAHFCDEWLFHENMPNVDELPQGLNGIYNLFFRRQFPEMAYYEHDITPFLDFIVAAFEPLSMKELCIYIDTSEREMLGRIRRFGTLLQWSSESVVFYHKSLYDWITSYAESDYYISMNDAHGHFVQAIWTTYVNPDFNLTRYELTHFINHLGYCNEWDKIKDVLCDLRFVQNKAVGVGTMPVVADYDMAIETARLDWGSCQAVGLVRSAIKKSLYYLLKRPEGMTSCIVNYIKYSIDENLVPQMIDRLNVGGLAWLESSCKAGGNNHVDTIFTSKERLIRSYYGGARSRILLEMDGGVIELSITNGSWKEFELEKEEERIGFGNDIEGFDEVLSLFDSLLTGVHTGGSLSAPSEHKASHFAFDPNAPEHIYCVTGESLWRLDTIKNERESLISDESVSLVFSHPRLDHLIVGLNNGGLVAVHFANMDCHKVIKAHDDRVNHVTYLHETNQLATASSDGAVRVWNLEDFSCACTLRGHCKGVQRVELYEDKLLSLGKDMRALLWDVASASVVGKLNENNHVLVDREDTFECAFMDSGDTNFIFLEDCLKEMPTDLHICHNGEILLCYASGRLQVWRDEELVHEGQASTGELNYVSLIEESRKLIIGSTEELITLPRSELGNFSVKSWEPITEISYSANSEKLLVARKEEISVLSCSNLNTLLAIDVSDVPSMTQFDQSNEYIIALTDAEGLGRVLHFWNAMTGESVGSYDQALLTSGKISHDTCVLLVSDCRAIFYDLNERQEVWSVFVEDARCAALSMNGGRVFVGTDNSTIEVFQRTPFQKVGQLLPIPEELFERCVVHDMVVSEDDRYLLVEFKKRIGFVFKSYHIVFDIDAMKPLMLSLERIHTGWFTDLMDNEIKGVFPKYDSCSVVWSDHEHGLMEMPTKDSWTLKSQNSDCRGRLYDGALELYNEKLELYSAIPVSGELIVKNPLKPEWITFGSDEVPCTIVRLVGDSYDWSSS